jgi:hypothetical protein
MELMKTRNPRPGANATLDSLLGLGYLTASVLANIIDNFPNEKRFHAQASLR